MAFPKGRKHSDETRQKIAAAGRKRTQSEETKAKISAANTGRPHRSWTEEEKTQRSQRDHFTCQACGQVGGSLNAHHIRSFARHPELRFDIGNGITLCVMCHKAAHQSGAKSLVIAVAKGF